MRARKKILLFKKMNKVFRMKKKETTEREMDEEPWRRGMMTTTTTEHVHNGEEKQTLTLVMFRRTSAIDTRLKSNGIDTDLHTR